MSQPIVALNDGRSMPQLGFGVWQVENRQATNVVKEAIGAGYRSIDTAAIYGNEEGVGAAIRQAGVPRKDLFITTKLWNDDQGFDAARRAFDASLKRLGLDDVDLYLIHWPAWKRDAYAETWRALVKLKEEGRAKSIGVSNFNIPHLQRLFDETGVVPAVNQLELHPYFPQVDMRAVDQGLGILTESWSPLGKRQAPFAEPAVTSASEAHGVSPAQVILRWQVQLGCLPIPKSSSRDRQALNLDIFCFELSSDEVEAITALGRPDGRLFGGDPDTHEEM
jgi:2,5-diketo-D-gluconate reductase A